MDVDLWAGITALVVLAVLNAVTSAAHAAWPRLNRGRLKHLAGEGVDKADAVLKFAEAPGLTAATLTIANAGSIALIAGLAVAFGARYQVANEPWFVVAVVAGFIALLIAQLAFHSLGQLYPDSTVFALLLPLQAIDLLLRPVTAPLHRVSRMLVRADSHRALEGGYTADEDLRMIVDAVEEDGALEQVEREMIHSIFEMGDTTAREIMVPRVDVVAVEASEPLRRILDVIKDRGHSRIPIYEESIDNIVGIVYAKDLLRHMEAGSLD